MIIKFVIVFKQTLPNIDWRFLNNTPGNRSPFTPTVYCKGISWPVPVDLLTCVNNFQECWSAGNRRISYAEIKVQDCYNTCFHGKLRRFLDISFWRPNAMHLIISTEANDAVIVHFMTFTETTQVGYCTPFKYVYAKPRCFVFQEQVKNKLRYVPVDLRRTI